MKIILPYLLHGRWSPSTGKTEEQQIKASHNCWANITGKVTWRMFEGEDRRAPRSCYSNGGTQAQEEWGCDTGLAPLSCGWFSPNIQAVSSEEEPLCVSSCYRASELYREGGAIHLKHYPTILIAVAFPPKNPGNCASLRMLRVNRRTLFLSQSYNFQGALTLLPGNFWELQFCEGNRGHLTVG